MHDLLYILVYMAVWRQCLQLTAYHGIFFASSSDECYLLNGRCPISCQLLIPIRIGNSIFYAHKCMAAIASTDCFNISADLVIENYYIIMSIDYAAEL